MPQFSAWRLFGELVTQLLSSKKNTKETEELNILLDAIILNRPAILVNHGFVVKPVMAFAPKEEGEISIRSLMELDIGRAYITQKATSLMRHSPTEVVLGDYYVSTPCARVVIPVPETGSEWESASGRPSMRGVLHPQTLIFAMEQFTGKKLNEGMLFYESDLRLARFVYSMAELSAGTKYISEDFYFSLYPQENGAVSFEFSAACDLMPPGSDTPVRPPSSTAITPSHLSRDFVLKHTPRRLRRGTALSATTSTSLSQSRRIRRTKATSHRPSSLKRKRERVDEEEDIGEDDQAETFKVPSLFQTPEKDATEEMRRSDDGESTPLGAAIRKRRMSGTELDADGNESSSQDLYDCATIPTAPPPPAPVPPPMPQANSSRKRLRPVRWKSIHPSKIGSTVWGAEGQAVSLKLAEDEIEHFFGVSPKKKESTASDDNPTKRAKRTASTSLGIRRSNNINITLARIPLTTAQLRQSICCDPTVSPLTSEQVEALLCLFPLKQEEILAVEALSQEILDANRAERWVQEMAQCPRAEVKLRCRSFVSSFNENCTPLEEQIALLSRACTEIRTSTRLPETLKIILAIGSVLNRDTYLCSRGFKLGSLRDIVQTKGKKDSVSFLNYLAKVIFEQSPELLYFGEDLASCFLATSLSLKNLQQEITSLRRGFEMVETEYDTSAKTDGEPHFANTLHLFLEGAKERLIKMVAESEALREAYSEMCAYFGEDAESQLDSTEFFSIITEFSEKLQAAHGANINNKLINTATNDEEKEGNGQGQYEGERQAATRDVAKSNQTKAVDENQSPNVRV